MNYGKKIFLLIGVLIISLENLFAMDEDIKSATSSNPHITKKSDDDGIDLTDQILGKKIHDRAQTIFEKEQEKENIKIQDGNSLNFWAELLAKKLAESKSFLYTLGKKVHLTVVVPVYEEINRMKTKNEHENGEDFICQKITQLDWFSDCPNFSWDLQIVDDGCPSKSGKEAKKIVREYSERTRKTWPVSIKFLKDCINHNDLKAPICPANTTLFSTKDSKKGGAVYYGLWEAIKHNTSKPLGSEHIILYTDADLSAHLGNVGFAVDQIINRGSQVSIGSRKLDPSLAQKSNSKAGKLWCYFWSSFFPDLEVTDTQVGFKAFKSDLLEKILSKPMVEHGLCFDMELLVRVNLEHPKSITEFPMVWIDSVAESTIRKDKDNSFLEMVQSLSHLYEKYGKKHVWGDSFEALLSSLSVHDLNVILDNCPQEISSKTIQELPKYRGVTAGEISKLKYTCQGIQ